MATELVRKDVLESIEVSNFAAVARDVCAVIDQIEETSEVEFLRRLSKLLPLAYTLGSALSYPWIGENEDGELDYISGPEIAIPYGSHIEWWKVLRDIIGRKLGWHRLIHFVFDPSDPNDQTAIGADLADIIADIHIDLKIGLLHHDEGSDSHRAEAVWLWHFGYESVWGEAVAKAMLPIHRLLHTHYDEDEERFDR